MDRHAHTHAFEPDNSHACASDASCPLCLTSCLCLPPRLQDDGPGVLHAFPGALPVPAQPAGGGGPLCGQVSRVGPGRTFPPRTVVPVLPYQTSPRPLFSPSSGCGRPPNSQGRPRPDSLRLVKPFKCIRRRTDGQFPGRDGEIEEGGGGDSPCLLGAKLTIHPSLLEWLFRIGRASVGERG